MSRVLDSIQQRENLAGEATRIYGAGRGGQMVRRELMQNSGFGLRPIGFLDDDPSLQGRLVHGVPLLGSLTDLRSIIEAQPISRLIVSSSKINGDRLGQASSICQEQRMPMLHARLKLEPSAPELRWVKSMVHPARTVQDPSESA